ncbi:vWA domain-containing protein [Ornithinibacillus bavariensis]|uniref:VWFA domain-containing protein n=1 Tax=Ornithinibacillus bavariensis TaxID=545502 RepID=A0A919X7H9_9BACI|nr:VWA domain-containing protein [Ornithinibacillus bavariensis]GIO26288.1 hypothetical protein J43TS3_08990 [Ornithinibacillus bavariensis]
MRKLFTVLCISLLFLTVACSKDSTKKEDEKPKVTQKEDIDKDTLKQEKGTDSEESSFQAIPNTLEDLKNQPGGTLVGELSLQKELETDTNELMSRIDTDLQEQIKKITSNTDDANEIVIEIIKLLGSPNYKEAIEKAEAFKPSFKDPYLPNPKKVTKGESKGEIGKAIILLDASSSMLLSVNGEVKMDIAKDAVKRFADVIGQESDVSLVVYGHKGSESNSDKKLSCEGIEEVYPMGSYDANEFEKSLTTFESKGWTPLAGAINKATKMSSNMDGPITVYIVSDGIETCDGDPVKEAEKFANENKERTVNIIGFNVDKKAEEQLVAVSEAGNGKYYSANNADEIQKTIEYEWLPTMADLVWAHMKAPGPWEVIAERDRYGEEYWIIRNLIQKEHDRIQTAINIRYQEDFVTSELGSAIKDRMLERYSASMDINNDLQTKKIEEIDQVVNEIKERVDNWTKEMESIKNE